MMVARSSASSIPNRSTPSFQPSFTAFSQEEEFLRCPTMTLNPLSFRFSDCPGPWTPYPIMAMVSSLRVSCAFFNGNSSRVTTFSSTPPKLITAMVVYSLLIIRKYFFLCLVVMLFKILQVTGKLLDLLGHGNPPRPGKLQDPVRLQLFKKTGGLPLVPRLLHDDILRLNGEDPGVVLPDQALHIVAVRKSRGGHLVKRQLLVNDLVHRMVKRLEHTNLLFQRLDHLPYLVFTDIDHDCEPVDPGHLRFRGIQA